MMSERHDLQLTTSQQIRAFRGLSMGVLPTGLTAPTMRVFAVMLSHANAAGHIDILKP